MTKGRPNFTLLKALASADCRTRLVYQNKRTGDTCFLGYLAVQANIPLPVGVENRASILELEHFSTRLSEAYSLTPYELWLLQQANDLGHADIDERRSRVRDTLERLQILRKRRKG